ncbi:MAG: glycoside hydrolase family 6 protein [Solirubrobacterales bacterium]|nr:glycoside hydrolase family 6 protein [Solirubrobacterales bacterium]
MTLRLLAAAAAALLLPAAAHAATATTEAESLAIPAGTGAVVDDAAAGGGRAALLWSTTTATATVTTRAARRLVVRARGDQCDGAPRMRVTVDGRTALDVAMTSSTWTEHGTDRALADGPHAVAVTFVNDARAATCDRNLRVDRLTLSSTAAQPLAGARLAVDPASAAARQAAAWRTTRPADAALLDRIATRPQAFWFGGWQADVRAAVDGVVTDAAARGEVPVLVAYNIPQRDCGLYSAGGSASAGAYGTWIRAFAAGIGGRRAVVVLEPDALAGLDCLDAAGRDRRLAVLRDAAAVFAAMPATAAYLDGGHDAWQPAATMAARLVSAGVGDLQGFALDVSNFRADAGLVAYGQAVAAAAGGKHFVLDTSRNGLGPAPGGAWCNPPGRALGAAPRVEWGTFRLDARLWVKRPGESDGTCNGGPAAGTFWPDYALGLASRTVG